MTEPARVDADQIEGQLDIESQIVRRTGPGGVCEWCDGPIPEVDADTGRRVRRDVETCGKRCRQARWRLNRRLKGANDEAEEITAAFPSRGAAARGDASGSRRPRRRVAPEFRPIRVAYADPPYIGRARRYYGRDAGDPYEGEVGEVDHQVLIAGLEADYPDGWALSCAVDSLDLILPMCPPGKWHLCPWIKQNHPPRATYGLHTCWEALVVVGGRQQKPGRRDWLLAQPARFGGTLPGRKPIAFAAFLFQALGLVDERGHGFAGDQLDDLFPGTGIIGRAWQNVSSDATVRDASSDARASCSDDGSSRFAALDARP